MKGLILLFVISLLFISGCTTNSNQFGSNTECCYTFIDHNVKYEIWVDPTYSPELKAAIIEWTEGTVKTYGPQALN